MKKRIIRLLTGGLALACASVIILGGCQKADESFADSDLLIVGTEPGFAPYEYLSGTGVAGVDIEISQAIADEMGRELVVKSMDFDGALAAVRNGKVDLVAAAVSVSEERKEVVDFSHKYVDATVVVVVNKSAPRIEDEVISAGSLNGKRVGVQQGNTADGWVSDTANCKPEEIRRYAKFAQATEDLKNSKIDCIVMDQFLAEDLVEKDPELIIRDGILFQDEYAIAVQKGNRELLEQVNTVIDQLVEDGKIGEFLEKHRK